MLDPRRIAADAPKPIDPRLARAVEQRIFVEIPDRLDLTELREQGGARHREHPIVEHFLRAQIRPAAAAVAHGGMKVRLHEIDELTARAEAKVDIRMLLVEVA